MMDATIWPLGMTGVLALNSGLHNLCRFFDGVCDLGRRRTTISCIRLPGFHLRGEHRFAGSIDNFGESQVAIGIKGTVASLLGCRIKDKPCFHIESVIRGIKSCSTLAWISEDPSPWIRGALINRNAQCVNYHLVIPGQFQIHLAV